MASDRRQNFLLGAGCAGALVLYAVVCGISGRMPPCPFRWLTGLQCPGCGSQRAFRALLEGHPLEAWSYNLLLPPLLVYLGLIMLLPMLRNPAAGKIHSRLTSPLSVFILLGTVILWGILRNILHI